MVRLLLSWMFSTFPFWAVAQEFTCEYKLECFESETCQATDISLDITNEPGSETRMTLVTPTETLSGAGIQRDGPAHAFFVGPTAMHVVTVEGGQSRYTVHMQGVLAVTYHGSCKGKE